MNVLIVDDQISIIEGMMKGVQWQRYEIENIWAAVNVSDAKKILQEKEIAVLFCDIEMPGLSGMDLAAWMVGQNLETIIIFLTSHAEFDYAKKAVKLGAFDYILQPAEYREIEAVLERAIEKWKLNFRQKKSVEYGEYLQTKETLVLEGLVYELIYNQKCDYQRILHDLSILNYSCDDKMLYFMILVSILDSSFTEGWEESLCQWTVENILYEITADFHKEVLLYSSNARTYYFILADCSQKEGEFIAEKLWTRLEIILHSRTACYVALADTVDRIGSVAKELFVVSKNNVIQTNGVLTSQDYSQVNGRVIELTAGMLQRWKLALERGMVKIVKSEVDAYLNNLIEMNQANFQSMLEFHQKFTQIFLNIISSRNINISKVFGDNYTYTDYNDSYQTMADLRHAVDFAFDILTRYVAEDNLEESYVEQAQKYVVEHLQEPIRVQDIAKAVGLNSDYLTKCFKKETGCSLKDYILSMKIQNAKQLLQTTEKSVSQIAEEVGYDNVSNFIQLFKKQENMTPNEYKKRF